MASVSVRVDFFRFGCELVDWVFLCYVLQAKERGRRRRLGRQRRPPSLASLSTLNVFFYVLCRVRVRFC